MDDARESRWLAGIRGCSHGLSARHLAGFPKLAPVFPHCLLSLLPETIGRALGSSGNDSNLALQCQFGKRRSSPTRSDGLSTSFRGPRPATHLASALFCPVRGGSRFRPGPGVTHYVLPPTLGEVADLPRRCLPASERLFLCASLCLSQTVIGGFGSEHESQRKEFRDGRSLVWPEFARSRAFPFRNPAMSRHIPRSKVCKDKSRLIGPDQGAKSAAKRAATHAPKCPSAFPTAEPRIPVSC